MQANDIQITIKTLVNLGQVDALIALRDSLKKDYDLANEAIKSLNKEIVVKPVKENNKVASSNNKAIIYNESWSYSEKFIYVLKTLNRFIKFREAADFIVELEGKGEADYLTKRLTAATRDLKLEGKITKVVAGGHSKTYWGLKRWLQDDGSPKAEHMYIEKSNKKEKKSESGLFDDL